MPGVLGVMVTGLISLWCACTAHSRASMTPIPDADNVAVVVLGYPSRRNGKPHPLQVWRTQIAEAAARVHGASLVVFTGRGRRGEPSEAQVMADLARLPNGLVTILEEESTTTWQNVAHAFRLVTDAEIVVIVSDPLHAARARSYWLKQNEADVARVFVTTESSFWDHWWLKLPTAIDAVGRALIRSSALARVVGGAEIPRSQWSQPPRSAPRRRHRLFQPEHRQRRVLPVQPLDVTGLGGP